MEKWIEPSGPTIDLVEAVGLQEIAEVIGCERSTVGQWFLRRKFPAAKVLNVGPLFELGVAMDAIEADKVGGGIDWKAARRRAAKLRG